MAKKWYVVHTYSGYENRVKRNLELRIATMDVPSLSIKYVSGSFR